jgi:hypothetical protein
MRKLRNRKLWAGLWLCFFIPAFLFAQEDKVTGKIIKATEKLNSGAAEIRDKSGVVQDQIQQAGDHVKAVAENVKAVINVFEPIIRFHLKRKLLPGQESQTATMEVPAQAGTSIDSTQMVQNSTTEPVTYDNLASGGEMIADNPFYNPDGTANLGSQNNQQFGCYLDIGQGRILDDIDASSNTSAVDLIFTATDYYGSAPMYALLTPAYVKNDIFANYYFRGPLYKDANIPVRQWDQVNESEIALTQLTGAQFDKIRDNNQLMAVVKRIPGFREKFESRTRIEGKVFAIKTEMGDRTAYGLMFVTNHYGTTGANGYLKIKLKISGFDMNGDGIPDTDLYQ